MPEQTTNGIDLKTAIDLLEDYTLDVSRGQNYQIVQNALDNGGEVSLTMVERILAICTHDLEKETTYTVINLNIISAILKKMKAGEFSSEPNLIHSAEAVLKIIKTTAMENINLESVYCLCFNTLTSYPDDTLRALEALSSNKIIEIIDIICSNKDASYKVRAQPTNLIFRLLKVLSPDRKVKFVESGTSIWFSRVIPIVISHIITVVNERETFTDICIEVLEMLTNVLEKVDFKDNVEWKTTLSYISDPKKYPSIMKTLMQNNSAYWHRLWIVFVRLLKQQLKIYSNKHGVTINSLLSVVEGAFKSNVTNRCRAFECWNILIEVFFSMSSDVNKRIQLLLLPLNSDNAKVEETAFAKQNTWWHLIMSFQDNIDKNVDTILIPFLVYCFGEKESIFKRSQTVPGLISDSVKKQSVQMFIEILGHADCNGCVNVRRLNKNNITTMLLVDHWKNWLHCLMTATKVSVNGNIDVTPEQVTCMWRSYLAIIARLPDNAIRKDIFNDLLKTLHQFLHESDNDLPPYIINTFFYNTSYLKLLKTKEFCDPIYKLISIVMNPNICKFYHRLGFDTSVDILQMLTNVIMDQKICSTNLIIKWILKQFPPNDNTLMLWTALVESVNESKFRAEVNLENLTNLLLWPLKIFTVSSSMKPALTWYKSYNMYPFCNKCIIDGVICSTVLNEKCPTNFSLCVLLCVLKNQLVAATFTKVERKNVTARLAEVFTKIDSYDDVKELFPLLMDTVMPMLQHLTENTDLSFGKLTLSIVKHILKLTNGVFKKNTDNINLVNFVEKLLISVHKLLETDAYSKYESLLMDELIECFALTVRQTFLKRVTPILRTLLRLNESLEHEKIVAAKNTVVTGDNNQGKSKDAGVTRDEKNKLGAPKYNPVIKKVNKFDNIVNVVVQNGEEYVVVKSNWKFNPKKLTENQKEKLQRKREDIPALYQDLSQSQDEIKLSTWKTDSQDTSTGSGSVSKPVNEDVTSVLKNLPSSEVVPNIMKNILSDKVEKSIIVNRKDELDDNKCNNKHFITPKKNRHQRVALKDRVFKNVKNLIEKSNLVTEFNTDCLNQTVNVDISKTPTNSAHEKSFRDRYLVNSAPPKMSSERPSRAKKIPKKFENATLIPLKRKQNRSSSLSDLENTVNSAQDAEKIDNEDINVTEVIKSAKTSDLQHKELFNTEITSGEKNRYPNGKLCELTEMKKLEESFCDTKKTEEMLDTDLNSDSNKDSICINKQNVNENMEGENEMSTPNVTRKKRDIVKNTSLKKKRQSAGTSRLEKILAIDTVEGHPLFKQTLPFRTRQCITNSQKITKRRSSAKNVSKRDKVETKLIISKDKSPKHISSEPSINTENNMNSCPTIELPMSEDVIESSQDSTLTKISTKRFIKNTQKMPLVILHNISKSPNKNIQTCFSMSPVKKTIDKFSQNNFDKLLEQESKDDIEFSRNKTMNIDKTEDMDTEPIAKETPIEVSNESVVLPDAQELANADTQSMNCESFADITASDITKTISESVDVSTVEETGTDEVSSPFKDDDHRKKEFMNDTLEISPIKTVSPTRDDKPPSPETSNDYIVIKLSSPVHSNGEPFEKCGSPEIFTNDNISPDKRDQSPPRQQITVNNRSPSSLSLKRNRSQIRIGGRTAQILDLCSRERLHGLKNSDEPTETKENDSVRRNLVTHSSVGENNKNDDEGEHFLRLERAVPAENCNPSVTILKRKLSDVNDSSTSPSSKRKRVSFDYPLVSTTVSVEKYIATSESTKKRHKTQHRVYTNMRAQKKLEYVFKLDSALGQTLNSFSDVTINDHGMSSLEQTPAAEIVETTELNDTDPICADLINCSDPIENIATELSSPTMRGLLIKELEGKIETVGDLAKMTELEVNRLCIKAPKVLVVKKVLSKYVSKMISNSNKKIDKTDEVQSEGNIIQITNSICNEPQQDEIQHHTIVKTDAQIQTNVLKCNDFEIQTDLRSVTMKSTQTDVTTNNTSVQTIESGSKSTLDIIKWCLSERPEFVKLLAEQLDESSKREIANTLPYNIRLGDIIKNVTPSESQTIQIQSKDLILLFNQFTQLFIKTTTEATNT